MTEAPAGKLLRAALMARLPRAISGQLNGKGHFWPLPNSRSTRTAARIVPRSKTEQSKDCHSPKVSPKQELRSDSFPEKKRGERARFRVLKKQPARAEKKERRHNGSDLDNNRLDVAYLQGVISSFNKVLSKLAKHATSVDEILTTLKEIYRARCLLSSMNLAELPTSGYLDYILVKLGEENRVDLAFQLFNKLMDHQTSRTNDQATDKQLLPTEIRLADLAARFQLSTSFTGLDGIPLSVTTIAALIKCCGKALALENIHQILDGVKVEGVDAVAIERETLDREFRYLIIVTREEEFYICKAWLNALASRGKISEMIVPLERIAGSGVGADKYLLNILLKGAANGKNMNIAWIALKHLACHGNGMPMKDALNNMMPDMRTILYSIRLRRTYELGPFQGGWRWNFSQDSRELQLLDEISFASVIKACVECGCLDTAFKFYDQMTKVYKIQPNKYHFGCLLQGCGRLEQGALTLLVQNEMEMYRINLTPTLLNLLLDALCCGRCFDRVEDTFSQYSSRVRLNRITYNILIKAICQRRNVRMATSKTEYDSHLALDDKAKGLQINSEFVDKVQEILLDMEARGIRMADDTWCTILDGCQNDVPLCLDLFSRLSDSAQRMEKRQRVLSTGRKNFSTSKEKNSLCGPGKKSYMSLLRALLMNGYLDSAIETAGFIESIGLHFDVEGFNLLLWGFGKLGYVHCVPVILRKMDERQILPDRTTYVLSIRILLACEGFSNTGSRCLNSKHVNLDILIGSPLHQSESSEGTDLKDPLKRVIHSESCLTDLEKTALAATLYEEMRSRNMAPDNELFGRLVTLWTEQVVVGHNESFPDTGGQAPQLATGWLPLGRLRYQDGNLELDLHSLSASEARAAVLSTLKALKDQQAKPENHGDVQQAQRLTSWSPSISKLAERYLLASEDSCTMTMNDQQNVPNLILITGQGKRSRVKGVSPVREALERLLEYELRLVDSTSEIWSKGNNGRIHICSQKLTSWLVD